MSALKIIVSCEHADNYIPKDYLNLFVGKDEVLNSHRGWDEGSKDIGKYVARLLEAPFFQQKISRLLIESNRSIDNSELFSEYSTGLLSEDKKYLISQYYLNYRNQVENEIRMAIEKKQNVIHISVHTFTPILNGVERQVDIGILYDESREKEHQFSLVWRDKLSSELKDILIMLNLPYNGADDGFTTYLRTCFNPDDYLGIELEVNQKYVGQSAFEEIKRALVSTLK
jgi:predicted N-formylglutamate amidohydrolase